MNLEMSGLHCESLTMNDCLCGEVSTELTVELDECGAELVLVLVLVHRCDPGLLTRHDRVVES